MKESNGGKVERVGGRKRQKKKTRKEKWSYEQWRDFTLLIVAVVTVSVCAYLCVNGN